MTIKQNAKQIKRFPLVPVGHGIHINNRLQARHFAIDMSAIEVEAKGKEVKEGEEGAAPAADAKKAPEKK